MARPKPTRQRARPAKGKGNVARLLAESPEREAVALAQQSATSEIPEARNAELTEALDRQTATSMVAGSR